MLSGLTGRNRYAVMTEVAAVFTELMEQQGLLPVVVGGLAVEIYTRSQYTTQDVDLVMQGSEVADAVLRQLGFTREGRHWYHREIDVSIEIPGSVLVDADENRIIKVHLPSGRHLYVIGIEDIILDRLRACVRWDSTSDCEWGLRLLKIHRPSLDLKYLLDRAGADHPSARRRLEEWLQRVDE